MATVVKATAGGRGGEGATTEPVSEGARDARRPRRRASASLESDVAFRVGRAHRRLREDWERRIADLGLSPPQASMLRAVCEWPGSGLRELARRTRTDAMNAKRLADHLERLGLVASGADPAHRQRRLLRPTERGLALAATLGERAAAWNRRLSRLLGPAGIAELRALLDRLEGGLDAR